jgi:hypothetical protein
MKKAAVLTLMALTLSTAVEADVQSQKPLRVESEFPTNRVLEIAGQEVAQLKPENTTAIPWQTVAQACYYHTPCHGEIYPLPGKDWKEFDMTITDFVPGHITAKKANNKWRDEDLYAIVDNNARRIVLGDDFDPIG